MNFRIDLSNAEVRYRISRNELEPLVKADQLLCYKRNNNILNAFSEGPLNFYPTYKYDDHSDQYDTSKKNRIPAWTDRILYYSRIDNQDASIEQKYYNR